MFDLGYTTLLLRYTSCLHFMKVGMVKLINISKLQGRVGRGAEDERGPTSTPTKLREDLVKFGSFS